MAQDLASWGLTAAPERVARPGDAGVPSSGLVRTPPVGARPARPAALSLPLRRSTTRHRGRGGRPARPISTCRCSTCRARPAPRMRRGVTPTASWKRIRHHPRRRPRAALRSSFILGYPGETEDDHDLLLRSWPRRASTGPGFFTFSEEPGTFAEASPATPVPADLALERLRECCGAPRRRHRERRAPWWASAWKVSSTSPAWPAPSGGARHRRRRPCRGHPGGGCLPQGGGDGRGRARPVGGAMTLWAQP